MKKFFSIGANQSDRRVVQVGMEGPARQLQPEPSAATVRAFCAGDLDALGEVFDRFARPVRSVAMSVLSDPGLADDATQETFLRAWKSAASFDATRPIAPWLFTIARRTAIDVHRREFRPTRGAHAEQQEVEVIEPGIEAAWLTWEVRLALNEIPEEEQDVLRLAYFGGLSHPEIAAKLGVPVGTVKSRSFRAHKRLAALLAHLGDEPAPRRRLVLS